MPRTAAHSPLHPSHRLVWVDAARGLALVSMFLAHTAPSGGPAGVLNLTEFLTAALFAALVGVGATLERRRHGLGRSLALAAVGLVAGVWLAALGAGPVAAWISVRLAPFQELTAPARAHLGDVGAALAVTQAETLAWTAEFLTSGPYRLPHLLAWALLGSVIVTSVTRLRGVARVRAAGWAGAGLALAAAALAWSRWRTGVSPTPYTASVADVALGTGLVLAALGATAAALATRVPVLTDVLVTAGSMTLSVYVAHQAYLGWAVGGWAALHRALQAGPGPWVTAAGRDDTWFNVAALTLGGLLLPLLWRVVVRAQPWRRGPLEGLIHLVTGRIGDR